MFAVIMEKFGPPEVLQLREIADPIPGSGDVLIAVDYASITFVETQVRSGHGPFGKPSLPRVPGNGVGGRVIAVGPGVDDALLDTLVVTTTGGTGGYAERALAKAHDIVPVPPGLELRDAIALLADGRTALMLHRQAKIKPGETVLVEAAGGGVGSLLVQLATAAGAQVIGAAGGSWKADLIKSLGAAHYVDYSQADWLTRVVEASGGAGLDLVFDGVGGRIGTEVVQALRNGGRISVHGMASGAQAQRDEGDLAARSISVIGLSAPPSPDETRSLIADVLNLAARGSLKPIIGQTFRLADAAAAHAAIEARATSGKTLLTTSASVTKA